MPAVRRAVAGKPHRREEEAAQRDEEYRAMFEFAGVGHARIDLRTGRLLRVNPKLSRITGYSEAELLNMTFAELAHPKGRAQNLARFLAMMRGGTPMMRLSGLRSRWTQPAVAR